MVAVMEAVAMSAVVVVVVAAMVVVVMEVMAAVMMEAVACRMPRRRRGRKRSPRGAREFTYNGIQTTTLGML